MNQDDIDPEFPLSHSFLWLIMHFSSNNHCTCRNGQIRVVKDIDSSVMQFCLCYDSNLKHLKSRQQTDKEAVVDRN